tara:strand:+ start:26 stop:514 length:489 start_codon:yes stop_codon:yes gene_type:complete
MANQNLEGRVFKVSDKLLKTLKSNLEKYGQDNPKGSKRARNLITQKQISYEEMKRIKNYFDNYDGDGSDVEYKLNGGEVAQKWVENLLGHARDTVDSVKRVRMDAGEENQYKKTHEKDKDNANPTGVGMVKLHKGDQMRNIMNNTTVYEEVQKIKDLINYLK